MRARIGVALRSTVFDPRLVVDAMKNIDTQFSSVWFPSVSNEVDALELCALSLGATTRPNVGTGVVRLHEYDMRELAARASTLSLGSGNRFILGAGTGRLTGRVAIRQLVDLAKSFRSVSKGATVPIYLAALGPSMVRAALEYTDGVLLNFCSPEYVSAVLSKADRGRERDEKPDIACYIKLFFSEDPSQARQMLVDEFVKYNEIPQYQRMFRAMGITRAELDSYTRSRSDPESQTSQSGIGAISMYNPSRMQVRELVKRFEEAGVASPVVYPYVSGGDSYKLRVLDRLGTDLAS